jgi:hypothetical protein
LCGRTYVPVEPSVHVPAPRHALEEPVIIPWARDDGPRVEVEAFALLSSLATDSG